MTLLIFHETCSFSYLYICAACIHVSYLYEINTEWAWRIVIKTIETSSVEHSFVPAFQLSKMEIIKPLVHMCVRVKLMCILCCALCTWWVLMFSSQRVG